MLQWAWGDNMIRLRELRKQNGLTMKQLGDKAGLAESTISLYENGKRQPDQGTMLFFANFFGVSVDYLLGRDSDEEQLDQVSDRMKRFLHEVQDMDDSEIELVSMFLEQVKKRRE